MQGSSLDPPAFVALPTKTLSDFRKTPPRPLIYSSYMTRREKEQPELEKAADRWIYATLGLSVAWLVWLAVILWKWP